MHDPIQPEGKEGPAWIPERSTGESRAVGSTLVETPGDGLQEAGLNGRLSGRL